MNLIVLGLCMLANLTGFSSGASFESADESLQYVLSKADFYEVGSNNIAQYGDVYNTSGENRYLEIEFENGFYLISKIMRKLSREVLVPIHKGTLKR